MQRGMAKGSGRDPGLEIVGSGEVEEKELKGLLWHGEQIFDSILKGKMGGISETRGEMSIKADSLVRRRPKGKIGGTSGGEAFAMVERRATSEQSAQGTQGKTSRIGTIHLNRVLMVEGGFSLTKRSLAPFAMT